MHFLASADLAACTSCLPESVVLSSQAEESATGILEQKLEGPTVHIALQFQSHLDQLGQDTFSRNILRGGEKTLTITRILFPSVILIIHVRVSFPLDFGKRS